MTPRPLVGTPKYRVRSQIRGKQPVIVVPIGHTAETRRQTGVSAFTDLPAQVRRWLGSCVGDPAGDGPLMNLAAAIEAPGLMESRTIWTCNPQIQQLRSMTSASAERGRARE